MFVCNLSVDAACSQRFSDFVRTIVVVGSIIAYNVTT